MSRSRAPGMPGDRDLARRCRRRCALERLQRTIPKKAVVLWGPLVLAGDLGAAPRRRDDGDGDGVRAAAPEPVALVTIGRSRMADAGGRQARHVPGLGRGADHLDANADRRRVLAVLLDASPHLHGVLGSAHAGGLDGAGARARRRARAHARARGRHHRVGADPAIAKSRKQFNQQGVETSVIRTDGRAGRRAIQWFSYDLPRQRPDDG